MWRSQVSVSSGVSKGVVSVFAICGLIRENKDEHFIRSVVAVVQYYSGSHRGVLTGSVWMNWMTDPAFSVLLLDNMLRVHYFE